MQTLVSLGEKLQAQAKTLQTRGASAWTRTRTESRALATRLEDLRRSVDADKFTLGNLRAAAEDAARAFAGHFRPATGEGSAAPGADAGATAPST